MKPKKRTLAIGGAVASLVLGGAWFLSRSTHLDAKRAPEAPVPLARPAVEAQARTLVTRGQPGTPTAPSATATPSAAAIEEGQASDRAQSVSTKDQRRAFLEERKRAVTKELTTLEDWYARQPPLANFEREMARRRQGVATSAARLGLSVVQADCRESVCRLEVVPDPKAKRHTMLRPVPHVDRFADRAALVRIPGPNGLRTVIFEAVGDKATLPRMGRT